MKSKSRCIHFARGPGGVRRRGVRGRLRQQQRRQHHQRVAAGARSSRSAPTSPIPRSSNWQAARIQRLRHRTDGSDRRRRSAAPPEFKDTSFDTIFRDLAQGKFEAVASAATITDEREKTVDFTNPYYLSEQAILVTRAATIDSDEDLEGKTVGAQQGTTGANSSRKKPKPSELRTFPEGPDAINALEGGHGRSRHHRPPVAENASQQDGDSKSRARSRPKKSTDSRSSRTTRTARRNQRRPRRSHRRRGPTRRSTKSGSTSRSRRDRDRRRTKRMTRSELT